MKTLINHRYTLCYSRHVIACCWGLLTCLLTLAQEKKQVALEIVSRQPIPAEQAGRLSFAGGHMLTIKEEMKEGKQLYGIGGEGVQALVPALTGMDIAKAGSRVWVYGDSAYRHSANNAYASVYAVTGSLIKSLGLLGTKPYAAAVAGNGSLAFAGRSGQAEASTYTLSLYDANGNKRWDAALPAAWPSEVFIADDNRYVAVSLYFPAEYTTKVLVYDAAGRLLYTHPGSVAGIAFLPSQKMVVCEGSGWIVYDINAGFTRLHTGTLPGVPVGRYPITGHASADVCFILSLNASRQLSVQAYDVHSGEMLAQTAFAGKGDRQSYRQLEAMQDGSIQVRTDQEVITLRMK